MPSINRGPPGCAALEDDNFTSSINDYYHHHVILIYINVVFLFIKWAFYNSPDSGLIMRAGRHNLLMSNLFF